MRHITRQAVPNSQLWSQVDGGMDWVSKDVEPDDSVGPISFAVSRKKYAATDIKKKRSYLCSTASQLKSALPPDLQRVMDLSRASNCLTTLPVKEFGFRLHNNSLKYVHEALLEMTIIV